MKHKYLMTVVLITLIGTGCSTKRYGRLQPVTSYESSAYSCKDIKIELSKIDAFEAQVAEGDKIDLLAVAGFLGDFGIGNNMERNAAIKTAKDRRVQLNDIASKRSCP